MNITSISLVNRTNFGLKFDPSMDEPIRKTRCFLKSYQPDKVIEWENKLEQLRHILSDDYSIYQKQGGKNNIKSLDPNKSETDQYTGIYLSRTNAKSKSYTEYLTSISDEILGNEALSYIITTIKTLKDFRRQGM